MQCCASIRQCLFDNRLGRIVVSSSAGLAGFIPHIAHVKMAFIGRLRLRGTTIVIPTLICVWIIQQIQSLSISEVDFLKPCFSQSRMRTLLKDCSIIVVIFQNFQRMTASQQSKLMWRLFINRTFQWRVFCLYISQTILCVSSESCGAVRGRDISSIWPLGDSTEHWGKRGQQRLQQGS